jgi:hypothetical protein
MHMCNTSTELHRTRVDLATEAVKLARVMRAVSDWESANEHAHETAEGQRVHAELVRDLLGRIAVAVGPVGPSIVRKVP